MRIAGKSTSGVIAATAFFAVIHLLPGFSGMTFAHRDSLRGEIPMGLQSESVASVSAVLEFSAAGAPETLRIGDRQCVRGSAFAVDVRDNFAFDIDEPVDLQFEVHVDTSYPYIAVWYDRSAPERRNSMLIGNGLGQAGLGLPAADGVEWYPASIRLDRARFAGLGLGNSDLVIMAAPRPDLAPGIPPVMTLCDIGVRRTYTTPEASDHGDLVLKIVDAEGSPVPGRVGIYDESGRTPLPSPDAVRVYWGDLERRLVETTPGFKGPWPSDNVRVFYVDGNYRARLAPGSYRLLVSRGMEYELVDTTFDVQTAEETVLTVAPRHVLPMASRGWYAGDTHLHIGRQSSEDNPRVLDHLRAEGLHVGHLLEMGDIAGTFFEQHAWGADGEYHRNGTVLIPGQEDPRTARLGHVLGLRVNEPVRDTERYYLYDEVLRGLRAQGSLVGYAHLDREHHPASRTNPVGGLALDVPAGQVDFVELMSGADGRTGLWMSPAWFDLLNLGYKLSATGGSDFMDNANIPGAARTYVYVGTDEAMTVDNWMSALRAGRSFATTGPMLDMHLNGELPGSELHLEPGREVGVSVRAEINPQVDLLDRLQLYRQGKLVAEATSDQGVETLSLDYTEKAATGAWFVAVALGKGSDNGAVAKAATSPIYLHVGDSGFCSPDDADTASRRMRSYLDAVLGPTVQERSDVRPWATTEIRKRIWASNRAAVGRRVAQANREYERLVALAESGKCRRARSAMQ